MVEKPDIIPEVVRTEAMSDRVEAARLKIQAEREAKAKNAPKITAQLLEGIDYREEVVVKLIDGNYGILEISPLGEGDITAIYEKLGSEKLKNISEGDAFGLENYDFFWSIVAESTGLPKELIKKKFSMGESPIIAEKILTISGMTPESEKEVESFLA